jgi:hypothetical protein
MDHFIERAPLVKIRSLLESEQQVARVAVLWRVWTSMERMPAVPPVACARQDTAHGVSSKCSGWPVSGFLRK